MNLPAALAPSPADPTPAEDLLDPDDLVAELLRRDPTLDPDRDVEAGPRGGLYLATGGTRPRPRLRYRHQALADAVLMNPHLTQGQLASIFGYTPGWISTVMTSDAFQALLERRRAETINPEIVISLNERARGVATQSMRVLAEKLSKPADQVPDALALRAFELSSKAIGMGGHAPPPPPPDPAKYLPELAERLLALRGGNSYKPADIVDVEPSPSKEI
jgi:hypothetical protein